jgi:3',5'-cyclic AMP phosphodiesterase CpdA
VIADPHITPSERGTWKVYHQTVKRLQTAIADINQRDVEGVLLAGDLTKDGTEAEFKRINEILTQLQKPFVAIPGNHDVPKEAFDEHATPSIEDFTREYTIGRLPFVEQIGGIELIGLNSATTPDGSLADTHGGLLSDDQLSWLHDVLPTLNCPIVALHHKLTRWRGERDTTTKSIYQVQNASTVAKIFAEQGVELVLTGHTHCPTVSKLSRGYEVVSPSTSSFPQAYALVHIGPAGTDIELVPLADRDGIEEAWRFAVQDRREQLIRTATRSYPIVNERDE